MSILGTQQRQMKTPVPEIQLLHASISTDWEQAGYKGSLQKQSWGILEDNMLNTNHLNTLQRGRLTANWAALTRASSSREVIISHCSAFVRSCS